MVPADVVERRKGDRISSTGKIVSLSFMTVIIYTVVGFCLASLKVNFGFWLVGVFLYHWQLANWEETFSYRERQQLEIAVMSGLMGAAIAYLVHQAKSNLLPFHWLAIGLVATINSYLMTAIAVRQHKLGAIALTTALAWLGLLLGWTAHHYPGLS